MEFIEKFIGFVDILGWKEKVKAAESGVGISLAELVVAAKELGTPEDRTRIERHGPSTCPGSARIRPDLDFRITRVSDCVVVSSEISPAGAINLVSHCWGATMALLTKGIMCRGYITRGRIYHTEADIIGTGYQEVLDKEHEVTAFKREADERGTPFVEIDQTVCDYVQERGDPCVKEMFSRFTKQGGGLTALFPFQRLNHSFIVCDYRGHRFDPHKEWHANENVRAMIEKTKERIIALVDNSKSDVKRKAEHYITALNTQLEVCKETDEIIKNLSGSLFKD